MIQTVNKAIKKRSLCGLIVRAKANRSLEIEGENTTLLWDYLFKQKSIGKYSVGISKRNGEPERGAKVSVSIAEVRLEGKGK
ncbi:hypothetical protein [Microbulbifer sp. JTAC008]|uniref:hypothetical protein n=1 Tax=unclassified Microbulbifer TaxID=2619833 RepID=UPI00403A1611